MAKGYLIEVRAKDGIVWAIVRGRRSLDTVLEAGRDIMKACAELNLKKALVDVRGLEGQLEPVDSFEVTSRHYPAMRDRRVITHCAIVDRKGSEANHAFFENVAVNRGLNLRVMTEPEAGLAWLNAADGAAKA
ncbi:MAG: hypothetical protein ACREVQ_14925 [Burkholderiales bacterium]